MRTGEGAFAIKGEKQEGILGEILGEGFGRREENVLGIGKLGKSLTEGKLEIFLGEGQEEFLGKDLRLIRAHPSNAIFGKGKTMQIIIIMAAALLFASAFSFLAIFIEDRMLKKDVEEFPLLNDEEFEHLWQQAKGDEAEFERLAAFESKLKQAETEYSLSLSLNPRAHYRMAKLFSQWGKEWDKQHGIEE